MSDEPQTRQAKRVVPFLRVRHPRSSRLALFATLILACGCGEKVGSISGKVTYKDKPIPVGTVTFFAQKNRVVFAELEENGSYLVENVPVGEAEITVETPNVQPFVAAPGQPPPPPGVLSPAYTRPNIRIPDRYVDRTQSGLKLDVQEGPQTLDLALE